MFAAVSLAFFVSGAAGLIFELAWFHRASLVFGNSVWATSLVLSSFMAGLALGSASVAWRASRIQRPLRLYAALEVVVAATGVAVTALLPVLPAVLVPLTRPAGDAQGLVNFIRFSTAFGVLVVPAAAMGATLPVLTGALTRANATFGHVLGRLYGCNTLGAVAGIVLAEIVLVPRFGVAGTAWIAGTLNLSAAAAAMWLSRRGEPGDAMASMVVGPAPLLNNRAQSATLSRDRQRHVFGQPTPRFSTCSKRATTDRQRSALSRTRLRAPTASSTSSLDTVRSAI